MFLYRYEKDSLSDLKSRQAIFQCTLSEFAEKKANSFLLTLKLNRIINEEKSEPLNGSIIIYCSKDSPVLPMLPGDRLTIKCTPLEITNRGNPYEFDYKFFMENHGIKYYAFATAPDITDYKAPAHRSLKHNALIIREKIIEMYKLRGITGERLALVAAITLGQKNMLDREQKQNFIRAGVMHIMAVSGLHVVILSLFIFKMLFFMQGRLNILRVLITLSVIWAFAFVTGLTPSVLRAALMFTFIQAGNLMERKVNSINSVLASAFVLILIRPSVIFDAGFLLSYSAVIYIICFYQTLYLKISSNYWLPDKIWQSAAVTIVAQAGTLPLTIMLFNRFPTYFIITNIIIVPLSALLVILGSIIPILFPLRIISEILASILSYLTGLTEFLTEKASSLPYSNIENIGMTIPECTLLAIVIFLALNYLLRVKSFSLRYPLSILILYVAIFTAKDISVRRSNEIIVYNIPGRTAIGIRTGKILNIYADTSLIQPEIIRHSATLGLKIRSHLLTEKSCQLRVGGETILICNSSERNALLNTKAGFVIVKGEKNKKVTFLNFKTPPRSLIISSCNSSRAIVSKKLRKEVPDTVHFVSKYGAYIKSI